METELKCKTDAERHGMLRHYLAHFFEKAFRAGAELKYEKKGDWLNDRKKLECRMNETGDRMVIWTDHFEYEPEEERDKPEPLMVVDLRDCKFWSSPDAGEQEVDR